MVLAFLALGALAWLAYALGAQWFGPAAGALAALILITRQPVLSFGARAYVDLPYLALVLGRAARRSAAAAGRAAGARPARARRPAAPRGVAVRGGLRGLAVRCAASASRRRLAGLRRGRRRAPILWALADLVVAGDPLHSLTGTRESAEVLERRTGLDEVPLTVPRRIGEILREPVLLGAAAGGLLTLWLLRDRARLPAVAGPGGARRVLRARRRRAADPRPLPAAARDAAGDLLRRRRVRLAGAAARAPVAAPLGGGRRRGARRARAPSCPRRPTAWATCATRSASRTRSSTTCTRSPACPPFGDGCRPVGGPQPPPGARTSRSGSGCRRGRSCSAQLERPARGLYVDPASARVERDFTLDPQRPAAADRRRSRPASSASPRNRSWVLYARCG